MLAIPTGVSLSQFWSQLFISDQAVCKWPMKSSRRQTNCLGHCHQDWRNCWSSCLQPMRGLGCCSHLRIDSVDRRYLLLFQKKSLINSMLCFKTVLEWKGTLQFHSIIIRTECYTGRGREGISVWKCQLGTTQAYWASTDWALLAIILGWTNYVPSFHA